jgi:nitrate/nitrite transporter NarK
MITVFFIGIGLSSILTSLARSPVEIALGLGVMGLFAAIYHPVGIALVVQHSAKTGQALGVNGVFGNLGVAVATGTVYGLLMRGTLLVSTPAATTRSPVTVSRDIQVRVFMVLIVAAYAGDWCFMQPLSRCQKCLRSVWQDSRRARSALAASCRWFSASPLLRRSWLVTGWIVTPSSGYWWR